MEQPQNLRIEVVEDGSEVFSAPFTGTIEVGRQRVEESEPYAFNQSSDPPRLVIAAFAEVEVSRSHVRLKLQNGLLRMVNISSSSELGVRDPSGKLQVLACGESGEIRLPCSFKVGNRVIRLRVPQSQLVGLGQVTAPPAVTGQPTMLRSMAVPSIMAMRENNAMSAEEQMEWLRNILSLFQGIPNSDEFYQQAVSTMAQMLELDLAAVLFREDDKWTVRSVLRASDSDAGDGWAPSQTILNEVYRSSRAHRQIPIMSASEANSLVGVRGLVAAPILSAEGEVIGAMYGDRRVGFSGQMNEISELETMFVEVLASGIAAGLARLETEKKVVQERVRFEQYFTAELAEQIEKDPDSLKGRNSEVTILFCDIRSFSQISELVGPEITIQFINSVMDELSECVQANDGVLVDYVGDELIAMWGAPLKQPEHASMAANAALAMVEAVHKLDAQWRDTIGQEFRIGIGINSGIAQVGNIGSRFKFKYGPLGNTVNVASRVQGATKYLRSPLLVTIDTAERLQASIPYRRICKVKLVNVTQPVTLCEIGDVKDDRWMDLKKGYEAGLDLFESGSYLEACNALSAILKEFPDDAASMKLLSRAVDQLSGGATDKDPSVWVLEAK